MDKNYQVLMLFFVAITVVQGKTIDDADISFTRDVRPILARRCFACHGPDDDARVSEMRLDTRGGLFDEEISPIVPRDTAASEMYLRITHADPDIAMPPVDATSQITSDEREVIRRWIEQGAVWENHWSFNPVPTPRPSRNPSHPTSLVRGNHPIDSFIRSRQHPHGLRSNLPARPYVLIRRLYLDLIGLPPTVEQADHWRATAFTQRGTIKRPQFATLVDELINSKQYGERWARRWLDLARYADTNGYEKDRDRNMWPYRDWVIQAINDSMPFDQFTIEQIAGDMLPAASTSQRIATGFHRNTMLNEEGGIDPLEFRFYAMTDRVATTGTTWLGLTVGCAQCHTHKYDPITHREYYQLMALMNNSDEPELDIPDAKVDQQYQTNLDKAQQLMRDLPSHWPTGDSGKAQASAKDVIEQRFSKWLAQQRTRVRNWTTIKPAKFSANLPHLELEDDGIIFASGDSTKHDVYHLEFSVDLNNATALRIEALPDPRLPNKGPGMTNYEGTIGDFFLTEFQLRAGGNPIVFNTAEHSYAKNRYGDKDTSAKTMIDGDIQTGWSVHQGQGQRHVAVLRPASPIPSGKWSLTMHFGRHFSSSLGKFRLSVATDDKPLSADELPPAVERLLLITPASLSIEQHQMLRDEFLLNTKELAEHAKEIRELRKRIPLQHALVLQQRPTSNPRETYIHHRGEFLNTKGESLQGSGLDALHTFEDKFTADRLGLAQWIVSPNNPLTARVVANRNWQAFFGEGIVRTLDDFGFQGQPPSHPQLLDHLASSLVANDWSIKWLHKYIVTSATYQQSSVVDADEYKQDPSNQWLSRFPRSRIDAEIIRDASLLSAGILSDKMFGPPVKPPQPAGITETAYGSPKWVSSNGEDRYRRSIYTKVKRTAPFAMGLTFDAPSGEYCTARRDKSNTALQALTLLNDVMFMEISQSTALQLTNTKSKLEAGDKAI
nr:PSD1 and planctomycete cytochrome C domain-containing protein [Pirellulaceae bacterium]